MRKEWLPLRRSLLYRRGFMLTRWTDWLVRGAVRAPGRMLLLCALPTLGALWLASHVELRTSLSEMVAEGDPDQKRMDALFSEFSGDNPLVVALERVGGPPASDAERRTLESAADAVQGALEADPEVDHAFHRVDLDWVEQHALYLQPVEATQKLAGQLEASGLAGGTLSGWASINDRFTSTLGQSLRSGSSQSRSLSASRELELFAKVLDAEQKFFANPDGFVARLRQEGLLRLLRAGREGQREDRRNNGYLGTRTGDVLFVVVSPKSPEDSVRAFEMLAASVRGTVERVLREHPGITYGLTGHPALVVEEMQTVRRDMKWTSALAVFGVAILVLFAFRRRMYVLLALLALSVGVLWSYGAVEVELGYLNLISSSFVSILVGVGIAYMIHPVSEYELVQESGAAGPEAIRRAFQKTAAAVFVSALTSAGVFFAILLMDYRGFAEMGLIAGVGVILCLVAAGTVLPALLALEARWSGRRRRTAVARSAVDHLWMRRAVHWLCRFPRTTTAVAAVVTLASAVLASGLRLDTRIRDLLPQGAESRRYLDRLERDSDLSPRFNIVLAETADSMRKLAAKVETEPTIRRLESALPLLPRDPEAAESAHARLGAIMDNIAFSAPPDFQRAHDHYLRSVATLRALLEQVAGREGAPDGLLTLRDLARNIEHTIAGAPRSLSERWFAAEVEVIALASKELSALQGMVRTSVPRADSLPESFQRRFVTTSGKLVGILHPAGDVFDPDFLRTFNAASRRVSKTAIGWPIMFEKISTRITGGFSKTFAVGAGLVFLVLLLSFRRLRDTCLAMTPLAMAVVWLLGLMRLTGIDFNLANLVALPLILGVGIDDGVHMIHRLRVEGHEGGMQIVLQHTGRAIVITSLTMMVGFGSLMLASHRGMASLGTVLFLGVASALVTTLVVLPNMLVAFRLAKP